MVSLKTFANLKVPSIVDFIKLQFYPIYIIAFWTRDQGFDSWLCCDIFLVDNYSTWAIWVLLYYLSIVHSVLCCLRRRSLQSAVHRSGEAFDLCPCSYTCSIEILIPFTQKDVVKREVEEKYHNLKRKIPAWNMIRIHWCASSCWIILESSFPRQYHLPFSWYNYQVAALTLTHIDKFVNDNLTFRLAVCEP